MRLNSILHLPSYRARQGRIRSRSSAFARLVSTLMSFQGSTAVCASTVSNPTLEKSLQQQWLSVEGHPTLISSQGKVINETRVPTHSRWNGGCQLAGALPGEAGRGLPPVTLLHPSFSSGTQRGTMFVKLFLITRSAGKCVLIFFVCVWYF